jgi:hypothetical protein
VNHIDAVTETSVAARNKQAYTTTLGRSNAMHNLLTTLLVGSLFASQACSSEPDEGDSFDEASESLNGEVKKTAKADPPGKEVKTAATGKTPAAESPGKEVKTAAPGKATAEPTEKGPKTAAPGKAPAEPTAKGPKTAAPGKAPAEPTAKGPKTASTDSPPVNTAPDPGPVKTAKQ